MNRLFFGLSVLTIIVLGSYLLGLWLFGPVSVKIPAAVTPLLLLRSCAGLALIALAAMLVWLARRIGGWLDDIKP